MFTFDKTDLQRITVSMIGAVLLSTICVVGAVAPAQAGATTQTVQAAK
jgi:hypothetical protein